MDVSKYLAYFPIPNVNYVIIFCSKEGSSGNVPDWVYLHWKHTHDLYFPDDEDTYGCTIVGYNDRESQIAAVNCDTEVADIVCQPIE